MTFTELKDEILHNARRIKMCLEFHDMLQATTYQEFIDATISNLEFAYRTGIITPALLAEFPAGLLEDNGIYSGVTTTLAAPPTLPYPHYERHEIWIINGSDITATFDEPQKYRVNVWDSTVDITASMETALDLHLMRATGTITIEDDAMACAVIKNFNFDSFDFFVTNYGQLDLEAERETTANITITDDAFCRTTAIDKAIVNFNEAEGSTKLAAFPFDSAVINYAVAF